MTFGPSFCARSYYLEEVAAGSAGAYGIEVELTGALQSMLGIKGRKHPQRQRQRCTA